MSITLYKVLRPGGSAMYTNCQYSLSTAGRPGDWMPRVEIDPCNSGYHLCRGASHLLHWLGPEIYSVETRGKLVEAGDKVVAGEVRLIARVETWTDQSARLFAVDCAEHVLPIFEREYPGDSRPRGAIDAARAFAEGKIDAAAASVAAYAAGTAAYAASVAAYVAASVAAYTAVSAAVYISGPTAACAAGSDARFAASEAARSVEGSWQIDQATDDAQDTEESWQIGQLRAYLEGNAYLVA